MFAAQVAVGLFRLVRGYFFRKRTISETWRYKPRLLVGFVVCMFSLLLNAYFIAMNGFISQENRDMREIITTLYLINREQEHSLLELPPEAVSRYVLKERKKPDKEPRKSPE